MHSSIFRLQENLEVVADKLQGRALLLGVVNGSSLCLHRCSRYRSQTGGGAHGRSSSGQLRGPYHLAHTSLSRRIPLQERKRMTSQEITTEHRMRVKELLFRQVPGVHYISLLRAPVSLQRCQQLERRLKYEEAFTTDVLDKVET